MTLLKQKDIMLHSMTQAGEKWDSLVLKRGDFWMIWTCYGIIIFVFMFRNVVREQLDQNNFNRCYGVFFQKKKKYLITTMFKVLYQQLWSTLIDNSIWKTPYNGRFYGHRCQACPKTFNLLLYASLSLKQA